jgi:S-disulfanyl-L-cysteine oxidoreductase SoxD
MPRHFALLAGATTLVLSTGAWTAPQQARSVWTGVYSVEQAERGRRLYVRDCAQCHGATLMGAEGGTALAGDAFVARWERKTVGALFDVTRTSMPEDSPGSLTERQYLDIVAYLLKENAFPAGPVELPAELDAMKAIQIGRRP